MRTTSPSTTAAIDDGVGAADVAVAQGPGQGGQGVHQVADVGVDGRPVGQHAHDVGDRLGQGGQQARARAGR